MQEPTTIGRVKLRTNKGDLLIELWSRECPKACRNFVQLCMEGYYDGTIFHRIIPGFIIQGGDASANGSGGDSVYGGSFPDEIHSRLRFRYRGILGVANAGKGTNTNGSQFFITLDKQDSLTGLHTMFGKVVGDSIYTLSNLVENVELDKTDRPIGPNPPRIISAEVIENPFPDIVPRVKKESVPVETSNQKQKIAARRGGALSFKSSDTSEYVDGGLKSSSNPTPPPVRAPEPVKPLEPSPSLVKPVSNLQSEIEKLQAQIRAATATKSRPTQPVPVAQGKRPHTADQDSKDPDTQLEKKFKEWTKNLHSIRSRSPQEPATAESSYWLKSVGILKFAIDSKTAFSKDSSHQ